MDEVLQRARERMKTVCRMCKVCGERDCVSGVPGMGGAGGGGGFKANRQALNDLAINMRLIHEVTDPEMSFDFFGETLSIPVLAAPVAGVKINMGGAIAEDEYINSVMDGCRTFGTMAACGDGVPDPIYQAGLAAVKKQGGRGWPVFKPWDDEELFRKLGEAEDAGAKVIGMDIDAVGLVTPRLMGRPIYPKSMAKLREIFASFSQFKFVLKGIMGVADALDAVEAGAAGIVVSNHGGRALDNTPGTAAVLPAIAEAIKGRLMVMVDGGVRSGADVLKMLALGADAVLIGRPVAFAAIGGGAEGVAKYFEQIKGELMSAMILTGCQDLKAISRELIHQG